MAPDSVFEFKFPNKQPEKLAGSADTAGLRKRLGVWSQAQQQGIAWDTVRNANSQGPGFLNDRFLKPVPLICAAHAPQVTPIHTKFENCWKQAHLQPRCPKHVLVPARKGTKAASLGPEVCARPKVQLPAGRTLTTLATLVSEWAVGRQSRWGAGEASWSRHVPYPRM